MQGGKTRAEQGGTYLLVLRMEREEVIKVGRLGTFLFPPGYYVYMGSALAGLGPRLHRHLSRRKKLHWHIDYLLERAQLKEVRAEVSPERLECQWAEAIGKLAEAEFPAPGFGASDCSCGAHLVYFRGQPRLEKFGSEWPAIFSSGQE